MKSYGSRETACLGKQRYRSKTFAKKVLRRLQSQPAAHRSYDPHRLVVYRCPWCHGCHIGHNNNDGRAAA